MTPIADMVARLIAAGTPPEVAATVVAEAFAAGVVQTHAETTLSPGAVRTRRWRHKASQSVTVTDSDAPSPPSASPSSSPPTPPLITTPSPSPTPIPASRAKEPELDLVEVIDEDPKARLFRHGKTILVSFGIAEKRTGSLLGQWLKAKPDPEGLLAAITFARDQNVADPVAYVSALVHGKGKPNGSAPQSLADRAKQLAGEARERERAAGIGRPPTAF